MKTITVLLIDDDPDDREMFCQIIEEIDSTIHCITKSKCGEALAYLRALRTTYPDFIFLDLNMPAINGLQCLGRLQKLAFVDKIPVVIYSTSKNPEDIEQTKKMGASVFLTKPGHLEELKKELQVILHRAVAEN